MSIKQIIDLNNAAAFFLSSGDVSASLNTLKKAMATVSVHEQAADAAMDMEVDVNYTVETGICQSLEIASLEDRYFYLFNRAPILDSSSDLAFANAALLFNMALTVHQRGLQVGEFKTLSKALRLYGLAIQLATLLGPRGSILVMAALNNEASIYYCFGDYQTSHECLKLVPDAASTALSAIESQSPVDQAAMEEILLNVSIIQAPTIAACA